MERRRLGRTDIQASVLGFGGSEIGYEGVPVATVQRLLGSALDAGLNVIDTAECYGDGETLIGRAVGDRRNEFHILTKCGHAAGWGRPDWSVKGILASVERSLKRLRTDRVDLVQLHSCSRDELERGDPIEALERARERGMTRYIGYSGDGDAARFAVDSGRFDTLQTSISIADQEALDLTLPIARKRRMGVIAKRPLANVAWRYTRKPSESYHHAYWERLRTLGYPFLDGDRDAAVGVALRFTLAVPGVHTAIVGTTKPQRWQQNAALLKRPLPSKTFDAIRKRWHEVADSSWVGQT